MCNLGAFHPQPFSIYHCERASANAGGEFIFPVQFICSSGAAKGERCTREDYGADKVHLFLFVKKNLTSGRISSCESREMMHLGAACELPELPAATLLLRFGVFRRAARAETFCYAHW